MVSIHGNLPVFLPSPPERKNPAQTEPKAEFIKKAVEQSMTSQQSQQNPHRQALQSTGNTSADHQKDGSWKLIYGNDGTLRELTTTPAGVEHTHTHPYPTTYRDVQTPTTIDGPSVATHSNTAGAENSNTPYSRPEFGTTPQGKLVDNKA